MSDLPVLDAVEQRLLGSLLEKQLTVPASYPLSLHALRLACNQSSSRDPVVDYDEERIQDACKRLKERELLRLIWTGKGSRTLKYHQLLDTAVILQPDERAVLIVLLLRGAQSPGELKTRTERLHAFTDRADVETTLTRLAALPQPLVRQLPRRPGQQDHRWIHLLGPVADATPESAHPDQVNRETVLADGVPSRDARVLAAYEASAAAYSDALRDDLAQRPFDVWLLERVSDLAGGPIADLGCGPGHIAAFLADTGAEVHGFDASPAMIACARADYADLDFQVARFDQFLRPRNAAAWGAVVSWYAFVHLAPSELTPLLQSVARTVRPGGVLAFALQLGEEVAGTSGFGGVVVPADLVLHDREQVLAATAAAGLTDVEWYERGPTADEAHTRRLYVLARTTAPQT